MLSLLSYDPILTTPAGLEPATSAVTGRRSNQLSHEALFKGMYLQNFTQISFLLLPNRSFLVKPSTY